MLGKSLKKDSQPIVKQLEELTDEKADALATLMEKDGSITLPANGKDIKLD